MPTTWPPPQCAPSYRRPQSPFGTEQLRSNVPVLVRNESAIKEESNLPRASPPLSSTMSVLSASPDMATARLFFLFGRLRVIQAFIEPPTPSRGYIRNPRSTTQIRLSLQLSCQTPSREYIRNPRSTTQIRLSLQLSCQIERGAPVLFWMRSVFAVSTSPVTLSGSQSFTAIDANHGSVSEPANFVADEQVYSQDGYWVEETDDVGNDHSV